MDTELPPANLGEIYAAVLTAKRVVNWVNAACLVLWIAEYVQLLPLEVDFVWPKRWNMVNTLFYLLRYLPFVHLPISIVYFETVLPPNVCTPYFMMSATFIIVNLTCAEAVMFLRVFAIGGRTRGFGFYVISHFVAANIAMYGLLVKFYTTMKYVPTPLHDIFGCLALDADGRFLSAIYGVVLFNEIVMMFLTLFIGYRKYINLKDTPIMRIFYLDGTIYFMILASLSTANIFINVFVQREYAYTLSIVQYVLHNTFANRMTLHLRQLGAVPAHDRWSTNRKDVNISGHIHIELSTTRCRDPDI